MCDCRPINPNCESGVIFCPLHAAAPLMLEACKMAELLFVSIFDVYDAETKNTVRKLRAAIAAAEPVSEAKEVK